MGRGCSWSAQALADVAAAYVEVSTNPVTVVERNGAVFHRAVYAAFVRRDPDASAPDGGYVARTKTAVIEKFKIISADCQTFGRHSGRFSQASPSVYKRGDCCTFIVRVEYEVVHLLPLSLQARLHLGANFRCDNCRPVGA
jgi:hypothetical protein